MVGGGGLRPQETWETISSLSTETQAPLALPGGLPVVCIGTDSRSHRGKTLRHTSDSFLKDDLYFGNDKPPDLKRGREKQS